MGATTEGSVGGREDLPNLDWPPNFWSRLIILSPANWVINLQWSNSSQLKCLAVLSCDLSLITMHISDCSQISDIHISQGSVATYLRCGGIFKYAFVANLPVSLPVKECWKSVNIWGSYGQEFSVLFFLRHSVYYVSIDCFWMQQQKNKTQLAQK